MPAGSADVTAPSVFRADKLQRQLQASGFSDISDLVDGIAGTVQRCFKVPAFFSQLLFIR